MVYQFQIDGRPAGPVRDNWLGAAWDAVNAGYATWQIIGKSVYLDDTQGATLERIEDGRLEGSSEGA